ncbi:DUF4919 domain-containing protein [Alistipes sp. OttesenSCG-928-B03]|nr:DUF4919 domain-containing protein [Alistipes sp. OttesenSCG-928-B03]
MRKIFIVVCMSLLSIGARAQEQEAFAVDYDRIREAVAAEGAYDALVARLVACDTTLEFADLAAVYYGAAFRPGYKGSADAQQSPVGKLLKEENYQAAWSQGLEYLRDNPVSLTTLDGMVKAAFALEMAEETFMPYILRLTNLLDMIWCSGDGKSPETAFKVIAAADEKILIEWMLQAEKAGEPVLLKAACGPCDSIAIDGAENFSGEVVYFDISLPRSCAGNVSGK